MKQEGKCAGWLAGESFWPLINRGREGERDRKRWVLPLPSLVGLNKTLEPLPTSPRLSPRLRSTEQSDAEVNQSSLELALPVL